MLFVPHLRFLKSVPRPFFPHPLPAVLQLK
nr:MAG TPA: hypothetical protein [Caudoviricetes sp.]